MEAKEAKEAKMESQMELRWKQRKERKQRKPRWNPRWNSAGSKGIQVIQDGIPDGTQTEAEESEM